MTRIESFEQKLIKAHKNIKEISKNYFIKFNEVTAKQKYKGANDDYVAMVNWFFERNKTNHSLVSRNKQKYEIEYTGNRKRSIRDIYLTLTKELGVELDFIQLINVLLATIPSYYCGGIHMIVFREWGANNPIHTNPITRGDYFYCHDKDIDTTVGFSMRQLIAYYSFKHNRRDILTNMNNPKPTNYADKAPFGWLNYRQVEGTTLNIELVEEDA